ncbi:MAG: hypothetical protein AAB289_16575, partial [Chloroflexota bacterium]
AAASNKLRAMETLAKQTGAIGDRREDGETSVVVPVRSWPGGMQRGVAAPSGFVSRCLAR